MRHDGRSRWGILRAVRWISTVGVLLHAHACTSDSPDKTLAMAPAGNGAEMTGVPPADAGSSTSMPDAMPSGSRDAGSGGSSKDAGSPPNTSNAMDASSAAAAGASGAAAMTDAGLAARAGSSAAGSSAAGSSAAGSGAEAHCSGCADEKRDRMDMTIHLHHVHLKSADRERSMRFYEKTFGAKRINLNGVTEALLVTPTLYLIDESPTAPHSDLPVSFQHVGFGSTDVAAWYMKAHEQGVMPDTRGNTLFNTNDTPTVGAPGSGSLTNMVLAVDAPSCFPLDADVFGYMYVLGPDQERIEVWTGADQRVNHLHFTTPDLAATVSWYQKFLGVGMNASTVLTSSIYIDDLVFFFEPIGEKADYKPTEDYVLSHLAFSVTDLAKWVQRARDQNVEIVAEPAPVHGFNSFFVRGPDGLLVEFVEAAKSPLLCPSGPVTARPPSGSMP